MTTTLLRTADELHARTRAGRRAVVMTMGALHEGHATLVRTAREIAGPAGEVVVTVFVNPLQFGKGEDLDRYPRTLDADLKIAELAGADVVFAPSVDEVYPGGEPRVRISAGPMGQRLEGAVRPGHFDGMLTVVAKLLHLTRPDAALFGQKDAQQLALIRRMVRDLNFGVDIVGVPTVREADGLALSSRNVFLTPAERAMACSLAAALEKAATADSVPAARIAADEVLDRVQFEPAFVLDYAVMVNPATFVEVPDDHTGPTLFVVAAHVGSTRLIDNMAMTFPGGVDETQESVGLHA
jgi:pantoate--beta-alanine ligase